MDGTQVAAEGGRTGYWSTTKDPYGSTISPDAGSPFTLSSTVDPLNPSSSYCAEMTGTMAPLNTQNYPYAAMEANFVASGTYDITANEPTGPTITGVVFDMKAIITGPTVFAQNLPSVCFTPTVRFTIADSTTTTSSDANGVNITPLDTNWHSVTVFFNQMLTTDMSVTDVLQTHALDQTTAIQVQWELTFPAATYDISVGNVQFVTLTPPAPAPPLPGSTAWSPALIDNCEQNTNFALKNSGRGGVWFDMADNGGNCPPYNHNLTSSPWADTICPVNGGYPFIMSPGGCPNSPGYCARITGYAMANASPYPFPGLGVHLLPAIPDTSAGCPAGVGYDQSLNISSLGYTGFSFYAKIGASSPTSIQVMGADATTDPDLQVRQCGSTVAGSCGALPTGWCNANHVYTQTGLTTSWNPYQVSFASLINPSWCTHNPQLTFDTTQAIGIQWQIPQSSNNQIPYDFSVDDVSFY